MFSRKKKPTPLVKVTQLSSLVAEGVEITGDIVFTGGMRIDGRVRGNVVGRRHEGKPPALLVLSEKGHVEGSVRCGNAVVNGTVTGDLEVEEFLELQAGARVCGTIRYGQLQMDAGAAVEGQLVKAQPQAQALLTHNVVELGAEHGNAGKQAAAG